MRIALGLAYEGTSYYGWQNQGLLPTLQLQIERALTQVADHRVNVICAGRTDKGVHALGQVVHFDSSTTRESRAWVCGSNSYLPSDIRVLWAQCVPEDFHARFTASARSYRYILLNYPVASPLMYRRVAWYPRPLDEQKMQRAIYYLLGEHDFSAFRAAQCQAKSPIRTITHVSVARIACWIVIDITANAFLHRMVRNIVGMLISIGAGEHEACWANTLLITRDRNRLIAAPASGLYLYNVLYPQYFNIIQSPDMMPFLQPA